MHPGQRREVATREAPDDWSDRMQAFGLALQRARHQLGMTQEEVAYASGLTRSHYQQLEKGLSRPGVAANPSLLTVTALAETLQLDPAELIEPPPRTAPA
jgi:transcriptional regulator with XRE-family HTH domain